MARTEKLVSLDEALSELVSSRPPQRAQSVPLDEALGMNLANDVFAKTTLPSANVSAMDGFAVHMRASIDADAVLNVVGESAAGHPSNKQIQAGEAIRISTGAVLPDGANHVVLQEQVEWNQADQTVRVVKAQTQHRHIREAGQDFKDGALLLPSGHRLGPADLGLVAAANHAEIDVLAPLRVAIITNGDELRWPGQRLNAGEIVNSNYFMISALCRSWKAEPIYCEIAGDDESAIAKAFSVISNADIVVPVGGASVGDHDLMKSVLSKLGVRRSFDRVALRPGKPIWFGRLGDVPILGLPGNPVAAFVGAHLFLAPLLARFDTPPYQSAIVQVPLPHNGNRASFVRAMATQENGETHVSPLAHQDTSLVTSLSSSNCLLFRPPNAPDCVPGDVANILWTNRPQH